MPDFRTTLAVQKENFSIQHQDQLLSLGSCFAQHIGTRLQAKKFSTVLNPFGILYNPASIVHSLESLLHQKSFVRSNLFEHQGIWYSFAHHGHFSDPDPEKALEKINRSFYQGQAQIHEAKCLLITLGTAQVFQHKKSGQIVANCHKLPAKAFQEQELSSTKIIELFSTLFQQLNDQFPKLKIILSLSPIRHLRHGLINNQRSKAQLLLAIHELVQQF
ncbi:MAG: GSCFA domain-containing protein, partial [Bacteroidota bacterium]